MRRTSTPAHANDMPASKVLFLLGKQDVIHSWTRVIVKNFDILAARFCSLSGQNPYENQCLMAMERDQKPADRLLKIATPALGSGQHVAPNLR